MAEGPRIGDVGEHPFLARLCERLNARPRYARGATGTGSAILVGPGDDCAVVAPGPDPLALTTDALIENVHFRTGWLSAEEIGRRAIDVSLSDLAAMSARPAFTLVAVAAPGELAAAELDALLDGCAKASAEAGAALIGGNLTRDDRLSLTVTAVGRVEGRWLERRGARPGDVLVVTGSLGGAAAAVAAWLSGHEPPAALRERFARPVARIRAGCALAAAGATAAIDLSDGLLADLEHLCAASGVGAVVERARLPRLAEVAALDAAGEDFAATGGDDYELLAACPPEVAARLDALALECGVELTAIGRCCEARDGIRFLDADGSEHAVRRAGFDHFARLRAGSGR